MFFISRILILTSVLFLGTSVARPHSGRAPIWSAHTLRTCEESVNCAVVRGEPRIDHALTRSLLAKRDDSSSNATSIVADQGTVDASNCVPGDIIQQALSNHCTAAGCTTDAQSFACPPQPEAGVAGLKDTVACTVTQDGQYTGGADGLKDMFVDVLQAAARAHTTAKSNSVSTIALGRREAAHFGGDIKFNTNVVPKSINAVHTITVGGQQVLAGNVRYTVSCQAEGSGECSAILDNVGAIFGMLLPESKAITGLISKAC
ncbi:hypothetical protein PsYK624_164960 [Phanerochaete sordida]|uniref:Uncharacterized protein n=1 Tax=Phanerochaete sordida TaxID=48140 RepID=A0A9P3GWA0_9APHY|nr:hypothetical protein PsYK624_164960 [Phanerochaete sordida]